MTFLDENGELKPWEELNDTQRTEVLLFLEYEGLVGDQSALNTTDEGGRNEPEDYQPRGGLKSGQVPQRHYGATRVIACSRAQLPVRGHCSDPLFGCFNYCAEQAP